MRKMSIVAVLLLFGATAFAEEFVDPATNIVYTLDPVEGTAEVKGGDVVLGSGNITLKADYVEIRNSTTVPLGTTLTIEN